MDKKQSLLVLSAVALGTAAYNILKPVRSKVPVIDDFDKSRYMGTWHEIARLDFFWEKNLTEVTATYDINTDGTISVLNRGFDTIKKVWKERKGKAKFLGDDHLGALKVSFFGPIYAGYNIMHIDQDYKYALVFGGSTDYMWILSREKHVPEHIQQKYVQYAMRAGYATDKLVWTEHD
ncbi:lipocalin family protein [Sphingobacterium sp. lm-10]|uniref:lipocalin family protein n=1 Tax=Sphingobacterium sp. lm-10 TaxID=2944904 RepID=UPI0020221F24|nr:lipocalin family protein [Sphingobacterium sp. lm-10]MCL7986906.1 lipocalin family protein [Sphingobacterium sp. lm-10]